MDDLIIVEIFQPFKNLLGIEDNGRLIIFKRPPLWS